MGFGFRWVVWLWVTSDWLVIHPPNPHVLSSSEALQLFLFHNTVGMACRSELRPIGWGLGFTWSHSSHHPWENVHAQVVYQTLRQGVPLFFIPLPPRHLTTIQNVVPFALLAFFLESRLHFLCFCFSEITYNWFLPSQSSYQFHLEYSVSDEGTPTWPSSFQLTSAPGAYLNLIMGKEQINSNWGTFYRIIGPQPSKTSKCWNTKERRIVSDRRRLKRNDTTKCVWSRTGHLLLQMTLVGHLFKPEWSLITRWESFINASFLTLMVVL